MHPDPGQALAHLEEAERHVREGELRLVKVRALVAKMRDPTDEAETFLARMETILAGQISHRDHLRKEVSDGV
jgi:hypothetical protein